MKLCLVSSNRVPQTEGSQTTEGRQPSCDRYQPVMTGTVGGRPSGGPATNSASRLPNPNAGLCPEREAFIDHYVREETDLSEADIVNPIMSLVNQTQPIEDGPPNIKMEGNDRQQANKDNITRPTNLENTTSSANVVRTVEPQTSMFASAERLSK
ncbi:hypothetical protein Bbelb_195440 [Branchiostoma belcheri]|nr:hypothetical protein Bbelb_195440 [Branchiostoma belcheri]